MRHRDDFRRTAVAGIPFKLQVEPLCPFRWSPPWSIKPGIAVELDAV